MQFTAFVGYFSIRFATEFDRALLETSQGGQTRHGRSTRMSPKNFGDRMHGLQDVPYALFNLGESLLRR